MLYQSRVCGNVHEDSNRDCKAKTATIRYKNSHSVSTHQRTQHYTRQLIKDGIIELVT